MNQKSQPLVSVVLVCYNHEKFILDSIRSVINQNYENIELCIIDDGSKDSSFSIIKSIGESCDRRFKRFNAYTQRNMGLSATLNTALTWVKGEYIIFIAADDLMLENRVFKQVEFLDQNKKYYACSGSQLKIDEFGNLLPKKFQNNILKKIEYKNRKNIFIKSNNIYSPTTMYRTRCLLDLGGYKSDIFIEDLYIFYKAALSDMVHVQLLDVFTYYRIHGGNNHSKFLWMHENKLKILNEFQEFEEYKSIEKLILLEGFYSMAKYGGRSEAMKLIKKVSIYFYHPYFLLGLFFLLVNK